MNWRTFFLVISLVSIKAVEIPESIPLWPNGAPGSEGKTQTEVVVKNKAGESSIYQVHNPSIIPYLPAKEKATGAAVIVLPGGGHRVLVMDHEGYNIGKWLSDRGIAAFVVKYRLARETNSTYQLDVHPFADTQRAIRLVRSRAQEWHVNPEHLGVIGFSAGGELAASVSMRYDNGNTNSSDQVEHENSKPNFQALIYPGTSNKIIPNKDSPPAFLACAYNDRPDISEGLAEVYLRFKKVKVPAELHIYSTGGHGFGYREGNSHPVGAWIERFQDWMKEMGFLE